MPINGLLSQTKVVNQWNWIVLRGKRALEPEKMISFTKIRAYTIAEMTLSESEERNLEILESSTES